MKLKYFLISGLALLIIVGIARAATTVYPINGGTGNTSYVKGDLLYSGQTINSTSPNGTLSILPIGNPNQVLTVSAGVPSWQNDTGITAQAGVAATEVTFFQSASVVSGSAKFFWDTTNKRLGIGTTSPQVDFHILASGSGTDEAYIESANTNPPVLQFYLRNNQNNLTSGTSVGFINFAGFFNGSYNPTAQEIVRIQGIYTGNGTDRTGDLVFQTGNAGSPQERFRITHLGTVGVGTATPRSFFTIRDGSAGIVSSSSFGVSSVKTLGVVASISGLSLTTGDLINLKTPASATFTGNILTANDSNAITLFAVKASGSVQTRNALNVALGGSSPVSYSRFGSLTTSHSNFISNANDVLISGDLQVKSSLAISGPASISGNLFVGNTALIANTLSLTSPNTQGILRLGDSNVVSVLTNSIDGDGAAQFKTGAGNPAPLQVGSVTLLQAGTGTPRLQLTSAAGVILANDLDIRWSATNATNGTMDTFIDRTYAGTLRIAGAAPYLGNLTFGTASGSYGTFLNALNVGLLTPNTTATVSYNRFGTSITGHANYITTSNDVLVSGDLEVRGTVSFGKVASISGKVFMPGLTAANTTDYVCYNTTTGELDNSNAACTISSRRFKTQIRALINSGLEEVLKMKPVSFRYKKGYNDNGAKVNVGFIAEDVAKIDKRLVEYDEQKLPYSFDYMNYTAVLTSGIQELYAKFQELVARVSGLEKRLDQQQRQIDTLQRQINQLKR